MSTKGAIGRNSYIAQGSTKLAKMKSFSFSGGNTTLDMSSFGDEWDNLEYGVGNYTISCEAIFVSDSTGAAVFKTAYVNKAHLDDLKFYIDASSYIQCDTADEEASMLVTGFNVNTDNGSVVSVSITLSGSGAVDITIA
jgi:hypothetical protein